MKTLADFKKEAFKKPGVRKAYEEMQPEFQIIRKLALAALSMGLLPSFLVVILTQKALQK